MEFVKNFAVGLALLAVSAVLLFLWVGIPVIWMSYDGPDGKMFTVLGTIWIFTPVALILLTVISWLGKSIRNS